MAVMFFGQYLVERGIVKRDKIIEAIALQEKSNLSFGDTAVKMGVITSEDADRINQAQRSEDMRIGDLAVKMGLLTENQVVDILSTQKKNHLYIGEAVVKTGGLTPDELEQHLVKFKADQSQYKTDEINVPEGIPHQELIKMMVDLTYKMITRIARLNYQKKIPVADAELPDYCIAASMEMHGDVSVSYVFGCSETVHKSIAKAILSTDDLASEPQDVLEDTLMEFVNVVCGNIVAKAAQTGVALDILPPAIIKNLPEKFNSRKLFYPVSMADGGEAAVAFVIAV